MTRVNLLGPGLLALALCGVIALECQPGRVQEPKLELGAPRLRQGSANAASGEATNVQAWVSAILARPLFEPSRKPPAVATASGPAADFPRLAGIIITPQGGEAIFAASGAARPIVVTAGSRLNGVLIKSIDAGQVVVVDARGERAIRPAFATQTAGPAAPAAPVTVDLPPMPSAQGPPPFAAIRGLSGRPLGLAANPDQPSPANGGEADTVPSPPVLAPTGGSP